MRGDSSGDKSRDREAYFRALFVDAQKGDKEKYREFLESLQPRLRRYMLRSLPSESLAADCLQETLLSIHRMRHTYDKDRPILAWVHAIARNKVIDFYRSGARHAERFLFSTELVEQGEAGQNGVNQVEAKQYLEHLLGSLPEEFQRPLILTKLHGLSVSEAAKELGISESLVKVRVHRAIGKLQKVMHAEESSCL